MITLEDIQKGRYTKGAVVYNTNNYNYAIVINGNKGEDDCPCSLVMELCKDKLLIHSPPNRALIPTGKFYNLEYLKELL